MLGGASTPKDDAEHQKLLRLLHKVTYAYEDREKDHLSRSFLYAATGSELGHYNNKSRGGVKENETFQDKLKEELQGDITLAQINLSAFRKLCERFGIKSAFAQESFFRVCRPGADKQLTFQELLVGMAPLIKGTLEQRSAWMFILYDADESGEFTLKELGKLHNDVEVGCVLENDLVQFMRYISQAEAAEGKTVGGGEGHKKCFRFDEYLAHVKTNGECALVEVARAIATGKDNKKGHR